VLYTPNPNYHGLDLLTFTASDGTLQSREGVISITVTSVYDPPLFKRGDCNDDGTVNLGDAIATLSYLAGSGTVPPCLDAVDADDNGNVNIGDPIAMLFFLFRSGSLPAPGPYVCGPDPTEDRLAECGCSSCPRVEVR
jgi:hypothetical protein